MVLVLVFLTVAVCLAADWLLHRLEPSNIENSEIHIAATQRADLAPPVYAGGFKLQTELGFHTGHAWALAEGPGLARVGIDDFSARLIGNISGIDLPAIGQKVIQGSPAWKIKAGKGDVPMLSPIGGSVIGINPLVSNSPAQIGLDPYGEGWLMMVQTDDLRANMNNLLTGDLVMPWMEGISNRLRASVQQHPDASLSDGGTAIPDLSGLITLPVWKSLVRDFLLTEVKLHSS